MGLARASFAGRRLKQEEQLVAVLVLLAEKQLAWVGPSLVEKLPRHGPEVEQGQRMVSARHIVGQEPTCEKPSCIRGRNHHPGG